MLKEKILANFQRIMELFTQKIVTRLSKIWVWDPGSGKNLFRISDPGVKKAPDPGSATLLENLKNLFGHLPNSLKYLIVAELLTYGTQRELFLPI
jgi:hypothetical protein